MLIDVGSIRMNCKGEPMREPLPIANVPFLDGINRVVSLSAEKRRLVHPERRRRRRSPFVQTMLH
jgi:hypothetical protein